MNLFKKIISMRNAIGLVIAGLVFAAIGILVFFSDASGDSLIPLIFAAVGIVLLIIGILQVAKEIKKPVADKAQYDRVDRTRAAQMRSQMPDTSNEEFEDYIYHFTGKMNQSQVMKTADGTVVYEAICDKVTLVKDTAYRFVDHISCKESTKMISHTFTVSAGIDEHFYANISSTFKVDGVSVWDVLAEMGYGFRFSMRGMSPRYEVEHWTESAGFAESAGTGLMNPKYANNPIGKVPTKGIYRVRCKRSDVPGLFLICFALSRTDETIT